MAKVDYGAVALIPVGAYDASRQYHANELVGYQGSSYVVLQQPPIGTLPTNTMYFMLHTAGTSVATANTPGTVKPDGTTTVVDGNGTLSVKPSVIQTIQDTATTATNTAAKVGTVPSGKTVQSEIDGLEPRVSSSEDALTVNLLNPTRLQSQTYYGITIVRNSDNTFTFSGTNEKNETLYIVLEWLEDLAPKTVAGKQYKFFGIPSGLTGIQIKVGDVRESGNGATFIAPPTGDRVSIIIPAGFSFSEPATFKPMITANLSATYDDYVPYSGSSGKLNTDYVDLLTKIRETDRDTVVNMLNPTLQSGTGSGLTYVKNVDNSYTISGTNNTENTKNLILAQIASIGFESGKTYRVLGCPSDTPAGVYMMVGSQIKENGGGANFAYPVSSGQSVYISVAAGATIETPITIKPMITTNLYATYDDYVPYTGESGRLNEDVVKIRTDVAQNTTDIAANAAGITALNTGLATKTGSLIPNDIQLNNFRWVSVKQTGHVVNVQFAFENNGLTFPAIQFVPCTITGVDLPSMDFIIGSAYSSREIWTWEHACYAVIGVDGKIYIRVTTENELWVHANFTYIV